MITNMKTDFIETFKIESENEVQNQQRPAESEIQPSPNLKFLMMYQLQLFKGGQEE